MKRARRWFQWMLSDLDADLSQIRRLVLERESHVEHTCDDEELRMYRRRSPTTAVAFRS